MIVVKVSNTDLAAKTVQADVGTGDYWSTSTRDGRGSAVQVSKQGAGQSRLCLPKRGTRHGWWKIQPIAKVV